MYDVMLFLSGSYLKTGKPLQTCSVVAATERSDENRLLLTKQSVTATDYLHLYLYFTHTK